MNNYKIKQKFNKRILWGDVDSIDVYEDLINYIKEIDIENNDIELDFEGIQSIDYSFINNVIIRLLENFKTSYKMHLIFNNIENDAIAYYLNQSLTKNNLVAFIKEKDKIKSIGGQSCMMETA
ncbi:STAS-like domain-containing protein [Draconibacterium sediminis]|uniref:DUF4325 domain-containing protein n=1 Tax=Draconibacterium sediminis TaxID=1544798 RepID=A0A0D8J4K6_9BACT|nr:DUF4325 domain-containing protein [Draconibacterium sediminis]KJF41832.1 hypothetical protein LH29_23120 [Draconibacterium sediminis]